MSRFGLPPPGPDAVTGVGAAVVVIILIVVLGIAYCSGVRSD